MTRGTPGWYRWRALSGLVFGAFGIIIMVRLALEPARPQSKIAGFAFAAVAIALSAVRVRQFLAARRDGKSTRP